MLNVGYYHNELEAATAVNEKCIKLKIPVKNPGILQTLQTNVTQFYFLIALEIW